MSEPTTTAAWMRALFDAIDDAVFVHDLDGNILDANPAASRRLGYTRDEFLRINTKQIDAPEFAAGFKSRLDTQLHDKHFRCEGIHVTKEGRRIPVDINTSSIEVGGRTVVLAVMRDITRRKQREEALDRQNQLLSSILDQLGEAVVVVDPTGAILLSNPVAKRLFPPDLRTAFSAGEQQPHLAAQPLARCALGEAFDHVELYVPHSPLGGRWVSVTGRPLLGDDNALRGGILVAHDISARRRAERHRRMQLGVTKLLAKSTDLAASAERIIRHLCEGIGMEAGILWTVTPDKTHLRALGGWNVDDIDLADFIKRTRQSLIPLGEAAVGRAGQTGRFTWESLEFADDDSGRTALAFAAGLVATTVIPIRQGESCVALLELLCRRLAEPDEDQRGLLQTLAAQIGQVLERHRVERALRDSEALFESLVHSLPQNIFRKDREGRFLFANQRFCETIKKPIGDIVGKTDFDLFPHELAAKYVEDDHKLIRSGASLEVVEEHLLPNGRKLFVQVVKTVVIDAQGEIVGVQGIFWDVTEKKIAEEQIANSERRYRQLTEATLDAIILSDDAGIMLLFNPAAERMFGYAAAEVVGRSVVILVPPDLRPVHEAGMTRYLQTREPRLIGRTIEARGLRKDSGEFPMEIALSVLSMTGEGPSRGPVQFLAAIRDVTERNKMRSTLVQNEKLASIGLLSAGVAHEINNPLAFVSNNLFVLERDCLGLLKLVDELTAQDSALAGAIPEVWKAWKDKAAELDLEYLRDNLARLLSRTRDGVDRVTRIIHSLRGLARTDSPRRQDADLRELINDSLEILRGKYKHSGIEVVQTHVASTRIDCVPTQLSQLILNLLVNAYQALQSARTNGGLIQVRIRGDQRELILEVEDDGPGVPPEAMAKIFDPFFTTKDVGEGTGLGLSISHHIVVSHGGRIEVENKPGACFRVTLPR